MFIHDWTKDTVKILYHLEVESEDPEDSDFVSIYYYYRKGLKNEIMLQEIILKWLKAQMVFTEDICFLGQGYKLSGQWTAGVISTSSHKDWETLQEGCWGARKGTNKSN